MPAAAIFMIIVIAVFGLTITVAATFERRRARGIHRSLTARLRRIRREGRSARGR